MTIVPIPSDPGPCRALRARRPRTALSMLMLAAVLLAPAGTAHAASQLVLIPELPKLVPLLVGFALLVPIVNALIVQPVLRIVDERIDRIEGARRRAQKLAAEAEQVLQRYESAIAAVREETDRERRAQLEAARAEQAQLTAAARSEAEREIEQARAELASSFEQARAGLRDRANELAQLAAERILGRSIA